MSQSTPKTLRDLQWEMQLENSFNAAKARQVTPEQLETAQLQHLEDALVDQYLNSANAQRSETAMLLIAFFIALVVVTAIVAFVKKESTVEKEKQLDIAKAKLSLREEVEREKTSMHHDIERHKTSVNQSIQREITSMHRDLEREKTSLHKKSCEERLNVAIKMERQILELICSGSMSAEEAEAYIAADYEFASIKDDAELRSNASEKVTKAYTALHPELTEADLAKVSSYKPQPVMERMVSPVMEESDDSSSIDEEQVKASETNQESSINEELAQHFANRKQAEA